jgi:SAM-dependent methyltransferase
VRRIAALNEVLAPEAPFSGKCVADVGCGSGELVRWLAGQGARVVGLDVAEMAARAESFSKAGAETYLPVFDAFLPLPSEWADLVIYMASLHHVPEGEWGTALEECCRVLKPGGKALIVEPVQEAGGYGEVTRLAEDETEAQRNSYDAIKKTAGLIMEMEDLFYMERSFADFCALIGTAVPDAGRRGEIMEKAQTVTSCLAEKAGVAFGDYRYRSICRLNLLRKPSAVRSGS